MSTTTGSFRYLDPATISPSSPPWAKVDVDSTSYSRTSRSRSVTNIRDFVDTHSSSSPQPDNFGTDIDVAGFAVYHAPAQEKSFTDDAAVRAGYYAEVETLLRAKLEDPSRGKRVKKVVIFDHTIRKHDPSAPRQPVQQVHVDQTPRAAEARVRRHVPDAAEAAELLQKSRYQLINVWRPIGHPATDFPLAVVDWRTTEPGDLVAVTLLYPARPADADDDDRGKEVLPDPASLRSTEGYEPKGETYGVLPNDKHRFYYVKDMAPDEAMFIKCFDSWAEGHPEGKKGIAALTPHTAFIDPQTPPGTKGRESIEVRCLVFYE